MSLVDADETVVVVVVVVILCALNELCGLGMKGAWGNELLVPTMSKLRDDGGS